jgi:hypothetical protein
MLPSKYLRTLVIIPDSPSWEGLSLSNRYAAKNSQDVGEMHYLVRSSFCPLPGQWRVLSWNGTWMWGGGVMTNHLSLVHMATQDLLCQIYQEGNAFRLLLWYVARGWSPKEPVHQGRNAIKGQTARKRSLLFEGGILHPVFHHVAMR